MTNTNHHTQEKTSGVESALAMYRETVSPSRSMLHSILNQIPEQNIKTNNVRAIRSPYIWLGFTQVMTVAVILLALVPTLSDTYLYRNDPFYAVDRQVEEFERNLNEEDAQIPMVDYTTNSL